MNDTSVVFEEHNGITKVAYYVNESVQLMAHKDTRNVHIEIEPAGDEIYIRIDEIQIWTRSIECLELALDDWFFRVV